MVKVSGIALINACKVRVGPAVGQIEPSSPASAPQPLGISAERKHPFPALQVATIASIAAYAYLFGFQTLRAW
jgi:hypothetical protein